MSLSPAPTTVYQKSLVGQGPSLPALREIYHFFLPMIPTPQNALTFPKSNQLFSWSPEHPTLNSFTKPDLPHRHTCKLAHTENSGAGGSGDPLQCPGSKLVPEPCRRGACAGTAALGKLARRQAWGPGLPVPECVCQCRPVTHETSFLLAPHPPGIGWVGLVTLQASPLELPPTQAPVRSTKASGSGLGWGSLEIHI